MWKILINSKGVPVLIEVMSMPDIGKVYGKEGAESMLEWEAHISAIISDESKHIPVSQSDYNDLGINWNTAKIGDLYDLPDWYKITTTKSYKVSLTLNEIKPESVCSPKGEQDGWISVKDRLPQEVGNHLVFASGQSPFTACYFEHLIDESHWLSHGYAVFPSHWMPLPPPPKTLLD